ncbi:DNA ligase 1-like isoform X1 [Cataglyphis hispanica]|uniref:DNA ligase 1-like isoform X1 n=1 Tax=Cataglyphis hispanica TaxID=1086592 RepID=UPI00217FB823|nr:DNA ligase 1-like isoform X1 [Cataglyphis hispanica]
MDHVGLLLQHSQYVYAVPVGVVLVFAILVFAFGFKKAEQPPFAQLSAGSDVDRKFAKKRGKVREKKAANGQIASEKTSPAKKTLAVKAEVPKKTAKGDDVDGKLKERKQEDNKITTKKEKEHLSAKIGKENKVEQVKNKKNLKNLFQEKPVDFDDGDWEQAYSRKDKKNKKKEEESPSKKNKKISKKADIINEAKQKEQEKPEIKDKIAKETENKELKEKEKKDVILTPISDEEISKTKEILVDKEEQDKVEKVEKEEKRKSKKNKKVSESENTIVSVLSTPKSDNKPVAEEPQEKPTNVEKVVTNNEENKVEESKEKIAVFDELGDVWTEAKPQKKSKKKARKDN